MLGFFFSFFVTGQILPDYKMGKLWCCEADMTILSERK